MCWRAEDRGQVVVERESGIGGGCERRWGGGRAEGWGGGYGARAPKRVVRGKNWNQPNQNEVWPTMRGAVVPSGAMRASSVRRQGAPVSSWRVAGSSVRVKVRSGALVGADFGGDLVFEFAGAGGDGGDVDEGAGGDDGEGGVAEGVVEDVGVVDEGLEGVGLLFAVDVEAEDPFLGAELALRSATGNQRSPKAK